MSGTLTIDTHTMLEEETEKLGLQPSSASALCLSGGGVRSAAFCLGVLQALAARQMLDKFHYLSTVSGGGYIGGFLRRAIAQAHEATPDGGAESRTEDGDVRVKSPEPKTARQWRATLFQCFLAPTGRDSEEVRALRRYTSYLAPQPGLASLDTWAGGVLWFRNTLINWMAFLPLLLAGAAAVTVYAGLASLIAALTWVGDTRLWSWLLAALVGLVGLAFLGYEIYYTCVFLPSHKHPDGPGTAAANDQRERSGWGASLPEIRRKIIRPLQAWVALAPLAAAPLTLLSLRPTWGAMFAAMRPTSGKLPEPFWPYLLLPAGAFVVSVVAFEAARQHLSDPAMYKCWGADGEANRKEHAEAFRKNYAAWVFSALLSAGFLALGLWLVWGEGVLWMVLAGPLWGLGSEVLRSTSYVALRRAGLRADLDREWLARLNAGKIQALLVLTAGAVAVLALPPLVLHRFDALWSWLVSVGALLTGPAAAALGKSVRTVFTPDPGRGTSARPGADSGWRPSLQSVLTLAALVFAATIAMLAGDTVARIIALLLDEPMNVVRSYFVVTVAALVLTALFAGTAMLINSVVNLNRFSMHAVYRNRLIRGFLGSARPGVRRPDLFTQFDPRDNVRLADTWRDGDAPCLFPVINVALNTTVGQDTAKAERKASSFTMTPLRCGSADLPNGGAYGPTETFAGDELETGPGDKRRGITLGTAMTISGAAVSPNMGYNSSPALAFLMTLFNVRLGAWLPNPAVARTDAELNRSGPRHGLRTLLNELVGQATDTSEFIYLSDGGHFDNLGLYEMLRRRCSRILVVDAGQDKEYKYFDLGHALQRALIDFGAEVKFVEELTVGMTELSPTGAYAEIKYAAQGPNKPETGHLIYLKPWLPRDMPTELKAFKALKQSFPHETTSDQFFTESDFESYRRLGQYLGDRLLSGCLAAGIFEGTERIASAPSVDPV